MEDKMICPSCRKETTDPKKDNWEVIEINDGTIFGIKFCPICYEENKDRKFTWDMFESGILVKI
jgi:hypothetical protein